MSDIHSAIDGYILLEKGQRPSVKGLRAESHV
jgi:hypothetical protein